MSALPHVSEALKRAIADIEPDSFNDHLETVVADRPLTPASVTVATGQAVDGTADGDRLADLGVGVQLIYEGLRLTRELMATDAWLDTTGTTEEDIDVLAAEVLVARGFNRLSETGTVTDAVELMRRFGERRAYERSGIEAADLGSLEGDTLRLAVDTGADAVLSTVPPAIATVGDDLASTASTGAMPEPEVALDGLAREVEQVYHLHEPPVAEERSSSSTVDP